MDQNYNDVANSSKSLITWIKNNKANDQELAKKANSLINNLCHLQNEAQSAFDVLKNNQTIGVFGASQAGKSYLISSIAAGEGELISSWDGQEISFITYVNPIGANQEATGIVTRFTHANESVPKGYPVKVKMLKEVELVCCLANTYFHNFEETKNKNPSDQILKDFSFLIEELDKEANRVEENTSVCEADVIYLAQYIKKQAKGFLTDQSEDSDFWIKLRDLLPTLNLDSRIKIYELFWGKDQQFTTLFDVIAKDLAKLKGNIVVHTTKDAFMHKEEDGSYKQNEIVINDVKIFDVLGYLTRESQSKQQDLEVLLDDGSKVTVDYYAFAAASAEITFYLNNVSKLEHFDVLDFPGCRSLKLYSLANTKSPDVYTETIRRGKIEYLFDRYNQRQEVDILLFCVGAHSQNEVPALANLVNEWVNNNVGNDEKKREQYGKCPVVGVITRMDQGIEVLFNPERKDVGNASTCLNAYLKDFLAVAGNDQGWMDVWAKDQCFNQLFFARKPGMSEKLYQMDGKSEVAYNSKNEDKIKQVRVQIYESDCSKYLYKNNEEGEKKYFAIDELLDFNNGGKSCIVDFLSTFDIADNVISDHSKKLIKEVEDRIGQNYQPLSQYANEGLDAEKQKAKQKAINITTTLRQFDDLSNIMQKIREFTELDMIDLKSMYEERYVPGKNSKRYATEVFNKWKENYQNLGSQESESFTFLFDELLEDFEEQKNSLTEEELDKDRYSAFINPETKQLLDPMNNNGDRLALSKTLADVIHSYAREIIKTAEKLDLKQSFIDTLEPLEQSSQLDKSQLALMQASKLKRMISDFNTYLHTVLDSQKDQEFKRVDEHFQDQRDQNAPLFSEVASFSYNNIDTHLGLPSLKKFKELIQDPKKHYLNDYFSAFYDLVVNINTVAESAHTFSDQQNEELIKLLKPLKENLK